MNQADNIIGDSSHHQLLSVYDVSISDQKPQRQVKAQPKNQSQKTSEYSGLYQLLLGEKLSFIQYAQINNQKKCFRLATPMEQAWEKYFSPLQIIVEESAYNAQYLLLQVNYHIFNFSIAIFSSKKESQCHKIPNTVKGNFSRVYKLSDGQQLYAVKCTPFGEDNFLNVFVDCLTEVILIKNLQTLSITPKFKNCFMFDMMVYSNCIEFCMEFCPPSIINFAQAEKDLKESLKKLHYLQIVHCDIKSDNIRFSPSQNKWVYIDFGLHKTIKEKIGEKSFTDFRGTLGYCGKQMEYCYLNGDCFVDMFYNDAHCLEQTLKGFKKMQNSSFQQSRIPSYPIQNIIQLRLIQSKYSIIKLNNLRASSNYKRLIYQSKLKNCLDQLNQQHRQQLSIFIFQKLYCNQDQKLISSMLINSGFDISTIKIQNSRNRQFILKIQHEQQKNVQQDILQIRKQAIQNSKLSGILQKQRSNNQKYQVDILCNFDKVISLKQEFYLELLTKYTQVTNFKVILSKKIIMLKIMHKKMQIDLKSNPDNFEGLVKTGFRFILSWLSQKKNISGKFNKILEQTLPTVLLFQIFQQIELIQFFKLIFSKHIQASLIKLQLFIIVCSSLLWLTSKHKSRYIYQEIYDQVYYQITNYIKQLQDKKQILEFQGFQEGLQTESFQHSKRIFISQIDILNTIIKKSTVSQSIAKTHL